MQATRLSHAPHPSARARLPRYGAIAGAALAALLLVWAALALVMAEGSSAKALVAVWLWTLPVLGAGSGGGWLAGLAIQRIGGR
jgi:hypothetical protein